jgi:hypothetical protein
MTAEATRLQEARTAKRMVRQTRFSRTIFLALSRLAVPLLPRGQDLSGIITSRLPVIRARNREAQTISCAGWKFC